MKKSHRREIFIARVTFAIFLVVVALIVALIVVLVSSHLKKNKADDSSGKTPVTKEIEKPSSETIPDQPETEGIIEEDTQKDTEPSVDDNGGETDNGQGGDDVQGSTASRWTTDSVRFRVEPNTECEVITGLSAGTEVEFISEADGWSQVKYNGHTGYISSEYLSSTAP